MFSPAVDYTIVEYCSRRIHQIIICHSIKTAWCFEGVNGFVTSWMIKYDHLVDRNSAPEFFKGVTVVVDLIWIFKSNLLEEQNCAMQQVRVSCSMPRISFASTLLEGYDITTSFSPEAVSRGDFDISLPRSAIRSRNDQTATTKHPCVSTDGLFYRSHKQYKRQVNRKREEHPSSPFPGPKQTKPAPSYSRTLKKKSVPRLSMMQKANSQHFNNCWREGVIQQSDRNCDRRDGRNVWTGNVF